MENSSLRNARKEALASIIKRDIAGSAPPEQLMLEWSKKADELIESALKAVTAEFENPPKFCVLSLGKLGGLELNYSSDVDLLYIYEGDRETATKIANRLTNLLSKITPDGFVYRVDLDLRPEGKQGPIVNTVDALERYYEVTGHEWERQALIRARVSAGDRELGEEFIERVKPFVFRRSLDIQILKKIRASKMALEKSAETEGWRNIKLGPGGIRETEFIVQALQLLNGGRIKELRVTNTFQALRELLKHKIITEKKFNGLIEAYTLLRRTENMLMAKDDRQVHTLPKSGEEIKDLAVKLGFANEKEFITKLDTIRRGVQKEFSNLFETSYEKIEILESMDLNLETCKDEEEIIDSIPWFKGHISKRIQALDLEGKLTIDEISERLTYLAETVIGEAIKIAKKRVTTNYGTARTSDGLMAEMSVVGMGKLGSYEMDYASDLDLIFVYSGDGETDGAKKITNHEYFTKIAQTVISIITLPTRYGRAYDIDTDLRPSGNQGTLVSSMESFERYHLSTASLWERQSLLRARVIAGDITLGHKLSTLINRLAYTQPIPHNAKEEIKKLREKIIVSKKLSDDEIDIKKGFGGIADIESVVHYLQLMYCQKNPKLQNQKLQNVMTVLKQEKILSEEDYAVLSKGYDLFRKILARVRLFVSHSTGIVKLSEDYFKQIEETVITIPKLQKLMVDVRKIYDRLLN